MKGGKKMAEKVMFTIKQARLYAGLSQQEVSKKLKVHRETYARWEKQPGLMSIDHAKLFANIVQRSPSELFFLQ